MKMLAALQNIFSEEPDESILPGAEYMLNGQEMEERLHPLLSSQLSPSFGGGEAERKKREEDDRFFERDLIALIHDNAKRISRHDEIYRTDLFFDMFPSFTEDENESVWCMPIDHPIHIILDDYLRREFYAIIHMDYIQVAICIWLASDVQDAADYVIQKCTENGLGVISTNNSSFAAVISGNKEESTTDSAFNSNPLGHTIRHPEGAAIGMTKSGAVGIGIPEQIPMSTPKVSIHVSIVPQTGQLKKNK